MEITKLLKLMDERGAKDDENLYSVVAAGYFLSDAPTECPCVALKEMEVLSTHITSYRSFSEPKMIKIIAVINAHEDADYYKCLTVGEFKSFLNNIEDKTRMVCVVSPSEMKNGWYLPVINACKLDDSYVDANEKTRKITGNNLFHLWI